MNDGIKKVLPKLMVGIVAVLLAVSAIVGYQFYMEYIQVKEIGANFVSVFSKNLITKLSVQTISFFVVFLLIFGTFLKIRNTMLKIDVSFDFLRKKFPLCVLSVVFAFFASNFIKDAVYTRFLMFSNAHGWGISDPVFGQDLSYYVLIRPFVMSLFDSLIGVFIFISVLTAVIYFLLYSRLGLTNLKELVSNKRIMGHVIFNVLVIFLIRILCYKFRAEDVLYADFSGLFGAGFTDINIWLKYFRFAPYLLSGIILFVLIFLWKGKLKFSICTALIFPVVLVAVGVSAMVTQYFHVQPAEVQVEAPYIGYHIDATRYAYGLDKISDREFPVDNTLTQQDLEAEKATLQNIRIIDYNSTKTILGQLQGLRNYYEFMDMDIAAYKINGEKRPIILSARELKKDEDSPTTQNYSNDKMRFTHGYGVVVSPVNEVTPEGHPVLYVKDIPLISDIKDLNITEPRIYYGEYTDDYSIVNTTIKEFDYLEDDTNVETVYQGQAGIPLNFMNRALFSLHYKDYQLLVSKFITSDSKILMNKNVIERVKIAAPFLSFDEKPYLLINQEGRLKWIVDAYTTTNELPYAQPYNNDYNYIRNSAKAVVDAYDGTVELYITDSSDPLIGVYERIYPDAFMDTPIPEDLQYSIRYPESYFKIQADMLKRYHTTDTTTFYNRSDIWEVAYEMYSDTPGQNGTVNEISDKKKVEPYYNMMKINDGVDLVLMLPFTITDKDNMVSWLAAGSDGDSYGELTLYKFPKGKNVYGPLQIEKRINSNTEISQMMTLWGSGGSSVIRGNMITIPVKNSLIYVEPIYITSGKNTFPELKMVIAAYDNKISIEPTLAQALDTLFKGTPSLMPSEEEPEMTPEPTDTQQAAPTPTPLLPTDDIARVTEAFQKVQDASKANDWEAFGQAMSEMEILIHDLNSEH
ncbi:MAG: UPF0182 family protein [Clostridia bacterium]|nr:UPF0182 family protein [Clostridia bacterium]